MRKHCGEQREWAVGIDRLRAKIGSTNQRLLNFRQTLKRFAGRWEGEDFLDYYVRIVGDRLVAGYAGRGCRNPAFPPLADRRVGSEAVGELRERRGKLGIELPQRDPVVASSICKAGINAGESLLLDLRREILCRGDG